MVRFVWVWALALFMPLVAAAHGMEPKSTGPSITGIDHVAFYAADPAASAAFYTKVLGAREKADPQNVQAKRYYFNSQQFVSLLPLPADAGDNRMAYVAYRTSDAVALRAELQAKSAAPLTELQRDAEGTRWFEMRDPEGNRVRFEQRPETPMVCLSDLSCHIIHAGFLVKDEAPEDAFYRQELHFRPYWHGAFTSGKVDWVSQQVPQGRDWLEYMLANDGSDTPANKVTRKELGGMDHISLGVGNMEAAVTMLLRAKRLTGEYNGPKMGLDGKWQTNLYDPDGTRIELMEYAPSMEPCCSPITGENPVDEMTVLMRKNQNARSARP